MMVFATLFDSFYLDKGLVLYNSLEAVTKDFKLYIFCFDDRSKQILDDMKLEHAVIIHHSEFEDEALLKLKAERSKAEYCWTCTPVIVDYVLKQYKEENCTYIDSDLYFFKNPGCLFDEIEKAKADVVITPHRFSDSKKDQKVQRRSGKYCVEFNYFNQSDNAWEALDWWRDKCAEWCFHLYEPERMGDQKYLEKFPKLFKGVHELQHLGGGVAPWNLKQYKLVSGMNDDSKNSLNSNNDRTAKINTIRLMKKDTSEEFDLVFYHFQNLRYISEHVINISSGSHDREIKQAIYPVYLKEINRVRKMLLDKYNVSFDVKKKYSSNKLIAWLQGGLLRFKIKSLSDIYKI